MTSPTGVPLTDPRELLEVYDPEGKPTGQAKARGAVHLEGDWHLAFFCWVARPGPRGTEILLQHRAARKDVWPLRFDASAAGHIRFGESLAEAAREVREELGIMVELSDMVPLGRHRQQHHHANNSGHRSSRECRGADLQPAHVLSQLRFRECNFTPDQIVRVRQSASDQIDNPRFLHGHYSPPFLK